MITMPKQTLQQMAYIMIGLQDESSEEYARMCDILLTMFGVITPDGNLAATYANSAFWALDGGVLKPSSTAEIATQVLGSDLSDEHIRATMESLGMDESQTEQFRDYLSVLGATDKAATPC